LTDFEPVLHDFDPKISLFLDKNQLFCMFSLHSLEQKWVYKSFGEFSLFVVESRREDLCFFLPAVRELIF